MPRGIFNWTFRDVEIFLKDRGFVLKNTHGSHFYYVGHVGGVMRIVCVPFHGKTAIKPRTMSGIIVQSGISKKDWTAR